MVVLTVLLLIFLLHPESTPRITNADDMPKPKGLNTRLHELQRNEPQDSMSAAIDSYRPPGRKQSLQVSFNPTHQLKEQLEHEYPYRVDAEFPALIWQCKYGDGTPSDAERSWTLLHPTFVHKVITDSVASGLIKQIYASTPEVLEAYNLFPSQSNFFRYLILFARGGIYADINSFALVPSTEWIPVEIDSSSYGMVIGIEADQNSKDGYQFCQWVIQAKPGHPILADMISAVTKEILQRMAEGRLTDDAKTIIEFTESAHWTSAVFSYIVNESKRNISWGYFAGVMSPKKVSDVVVLPITSFSSGVRSDHRYTSDQRSKHEFGGT